MKTLEQVKEITPSDVQEIIDNENPNVIIIDVREDEEVAEGKIEQAKHIPLGNIPVELSNLDKDKHYILVCRSGGRSMNAAMYMKEHGYDVSSMAGGMLEWDGEIIV